MDSEHWLPEGTRRDRGHRERELERNSELQSRGCVILISALPRGERKVETERSV